MATDCVTSSGTAPAGVDLTTKQYTLVKKNSSGQLVAAGAGDPAAVLLDNPALGRWGTVALAGVSKVIAGATVAADDFLSSDANGRAVTADTTTSVVGKAVTAGVTADVIEMLVAVSPPALGEDGMGLYADVG